MIKKKDWNFFFFFKRELCHFLRMWEQSSSDLVQLLLPCGSCKNGEVLAAKLKDSVLFGDNVIGFLPVIPNPMSDFCE